MCLTFVFSALIFCVVSNFFSGGEKAPTETPGSNVDGVEVKTTRAASSSSFSKEHLLEVPLSMKINIVARFVYAALFVVFVILYFAVYMILRETNK
jgi:hypothetical protein